MNTCVRVASPGDDGKTHLALERLYRQVDNHVCLEGLLLDEALEAHMTLERSDAVVDEHVPLQVGRQRELARAHVTLVAFNPLHSPNTRGRVFIIQMKATSSTETKDNFKAYFAVFL